MTVTSTLLSINLIFGQDLPELPMKNDMVFYQFDHKLTNTKKCLSSYLDVQNTKFYQKLIAKNMELTSNKSKILSNQNYSCILTFSEMGLICIDTASTGSMHLTLPVEIKPTTPWNLGKKKVGGHYFTSAIEIIFSAKNQYTIKFKGFVYHATFSEGMTVKTEEISLEELYAGMKSNDSKSKSDIALIKDFDYFINQLDRIILETFSELVKVDEL